MGEDITDLLHAADGGDRAALDQAFTLVYEHLKQIARRQRGGSQDTLSTTGLVHETYLKLVRARELAITGRLHFFNLAARAMRHVLLDRARGLNARKRPDGKLREALDDDLSPSLVDADVISTEMIDLDRAVNKLHDLDRTLAELVGLRLFAGLEFDEIAQLREVSERTVFRDWRRARAVLMAELDPGGPPSAA